MFFHSFPPSVTFFKSIILNYLKQNLLEIIPARPYCKYFMNHRGFKKDCENFGAGGVPARLLHWTEHNAGAGDSEVWSPKAAELGPGPRASLAPKTLSPSP